MKPSYDFSKGKRGPARPSQPEQPGKVKISIRLDTDIVDHFMAEAEKFRGQVGYQTLINDALRRSIDGPALAELVRQAVREEFKAAHPTA
ncbi:MAG: BrnA antitoxin family protein [Acidobacteriaceae bacterium]|nr:BrnA antitoxin family protein [Acidobacteriaceae bacterium]MBV9304547.1 BrnA antitoxin family protein [Acidobacteriaceae bacterium]